LLQIPIGRTAATGARSTEEINRQSAKGDAWCFAVVLRDVQQPPGFVSTSIRAK
jgi:hypothetical protein